MSAIAGLWFRDGLPVPRRVLERMTGTLAHRGRDARGVWLDGPIGFGHCLRRTTPGPCGQHERTTRGSRRLVLVADARIDNRDELIASLGLTGRPSSDIGDDELILAAYERWGAGCPDRLVGDFAFAIWDGQAQRLFCARDALGVRPFHYHHSSRAFAFASELKALLQVPEVPQRLDETRVADHLIASFDDQVRTFYRDIARLPAAHSLTVTRDGLRLRRHWSLDPSRELRLRSDAEYVEAFRERFIESVRARLRASVPVGSLLSGGLDSSSIVCTARRLLPDDGSERLHTFSAIFPDLPAHDRRQIDERRFIDAVVAPGGLKPQYVRADRVSPLQDIERVLWHEDEPVLAPNLYMHWALFGAAERSGVGVLLDGIDGDTTVSHGLERLADLARTGRWRALVTEAVALSGKASASFSPRRIIWEYGVRPLVPGPAVTVWRAVRLRRGAGPPAHGVVNAAFARREGVVDRVRSATEGETPSRDGRHAHWRALTSGLLPATLEIADKAAAAFSLEPRYPFFDRRLVEFCLAVPAEQKLQGGWTRMILRRAMADILPDGVRWRTRKANLAPNFQRGLRHGDGPLIEDVVLRDPRAIEDYVDVPALRSLYHRWISQPQPGGDDALAIYGAVTLACWLRRWGTVRVTPEPAPVTERETGWLEAPAASGAMR